MNLLSYSCLEQFLFEAETYTFKKVLYHNYFQ